MVRLGLALAMVWTVGCATKPPPRPPCACRARGRPPTHPRGASAPGDGGRLLGLADRALSRKPPAPAALKTAEDLLRRAGGGHGEPFEVYWRRARLWFLRAEVAEGDEGLTLRAAKKGAMAAEAAVSEESERVEGHYYLALNLGKQAEIERTLALVKRMATAGERAVDIDPAYDDGGPLVMMGKLYLSAPPWPVSIGDTEKAIAYLERAVAIAPRPLTYLFLAQAYLEDERYEGADEALARATASPEELEPKWQREAELTRERLEGAR